ncbi:MAG: DUF5056 domain-containing protein [Gammaproteobacteria bacterium]|nr:DUF5056 domain-containing protein [Gammaproteobacteria bacterium]
MNNDLDPRLQTLFADAKQELADEDFTARVMSQVDKLTRRKIIAWACVGLVLVPGAWLLAGLLQDTVSLLTQVVPISLADVQNRWLATVLSPVNSVASLVVFGLFALRIAYKKIF